MRAIGVVGLLGLAALCGCREENSEKAFGEERGRTSAKDQAAEAVPRAPQAEPPAPGPERSEPTMVPTSAGGREDPPDAGGPRIEPAPGSAHDRRDSDHQNRQNQELAPGKDAPKQPDGVDRRPKP